MLHIHGLEISVFLGSSFMFDLCFQHNPYHTEQTSVKEDVKPFGHKLMSGIAVSNGRFIFSFLRIFNTDFYSSCHSFQYLGIHIYLYMQVHNILYA